MGNFITNAIFIIFVIGTLWMVTKMFNSEETRKSKKAVEKLETTMQYSTPETRVYTNNQEPDDIVEYDIGRIKSIRNLVDVKSEFEIEDLPKLILQIHTYNKQYILCLLDDGKYKIGRYDSELELNCGANAVYLKDDSVSRGAHITITKDASGEFVVKTTKSNTFIISNGSESLMPETYRIKHNLKIKLGTKNIKSSNTRFCTYITFLDPMKVMFPQTRVVANDKVQGYLPRKSNATNTMV